MKKLAVAKPDFSSMVSNLLIFSAVVAVSLPLLLGDRLVVIVSDVFHQLSILLQQINIAMQKFLS